MMGDNSTDPPNLVPDPMPEAIYLFRGKAPGEYVWREETTLIAEWNNHGEGAPYEFADVLVLDAAGQQSLAGALDVAKRSTPGRFAAIVAERFESWLDFHRFLVNHKISFEAPSVRPEMRASARVGPSR
jgi:hypothetical protein